MENKQIKNTSQATKSKFERASSWALAKVRGSFVGKFFTSYEKANKSYISKTKGLKNQGNKHKTRRKVSKIFENSFFVNLVPKITSFLLRTSLRDYGIIMISMGIFMSILYPIRSFVTILDVPFESFIMGLILAGCSIPLLFSAKSYASGVLSSRLVSFIFFQCLGLKADNFRLANEQTTHTSSNISFFVGMFMGIISYFASPSFILIALLVLLLGYAVLTTPESGIVVLLFAIPFISIDLFILMTIYVDICYIIKYIIGKRTLKFELFDIAISAIMLMIVISYAFCLDHRTSLVPTLINAALVLCYFAVSNLIRSKQWFTRCLVSLTLSVTLASVIGIVQFILKELKVIVPNFDAFSSINERITSTFYNPDVFAIYLCAIVPFILLFIFSGNRAMSRIYGVFSLALVITCIILNQSKAALIAVIVEMLLFLIIYNKNFIYLAMVAAVAIPIFHYTLPADMLALINSFGKSAELTSPSTAIINRTTWQIFKRFPFGIGFGENNFAEALDRVNLDLNGATDLGSIYRQLLISSGILGIIILTAFSILFLILAFTLCAKAKNKHIRINGAAGFVSIIGIFVSGIFCYSLKSSELVFISFIAIALTFSYYKIERELDKPTSVYVDITSASVDIEIPAEFTKNTTPKRKYVHAPIKKKSKAQIKRNPFDELMNSNEFIRIVDDNTEVGDD